MKELFKIQIKNPTHKMLLILSISLLSFPLYSQYTLTDESGHFGTYEEAYQNNMSVSWDINVGSSKFLILNYSVELDYYSADYINIYSVDENGSQYLLATYSASEYGEIKTTIPSGRARVEFITDGYGCYYDDYVGWGIVISYYTDNTVYTPENMEVKYNTKINGNLEIGTRTSSANSQLLIKGKIKARKVEMTNIGWADFVFNSDYKLPALTEVDEYIAKHKHLPGMPSAAEVKENGVKVSELQMKLLQKIEELTLYVIQNQKDLDALK